MTPTIFSFVQRLPAVARRSLCRESPVLRRKPDPSLVFFFWLLQNLPILHRLHKRLTENFHPFRGNARSRDDGTANLVGSQDHRSQAPGRIGGFVLVHKLGESRNNGEGRIPLIAGLDDDADKSLLAPGMERLTGKEGGDSECAAL